MPGLKLLFLGVLSVICHSSKAQSPYLKHYTDIDGLRSTNIYKIVRDREDFLWFCTNNGVYRFNGFDFKSYNLSNGFPGDGSFTAALDKKGRIWFITFQESVCFYENYSFHTFRTPYKISWILFDKAGEMTLLTMNGHLLQYRHDTLYRDITVSETKLSYGYPISADEYIVHSSSMSKFYRVKNGVVTPIKYEGARYRFFRVFELKDGTILGTCVNRFYKLRGDSMVRLKINANKIIRDDIIDVYDDGEHLWICAENGLFKCRNNPLGEDLEKVNDKGVSTSIIQDQNGNYWFSTFGNGVFTFKSKDITNTFCPHELGQKVERVLGYGPGETYAFYSSGSIKKLTYDRSGFALKDILVTDGRIKQAARNFNKEFLVGTSNAQYFFDGKHLRQIDFGACRYKEDVNGAVHVFNYLNRLYTIKNNGMDSVTFCSPDPYSEKSHVADFAVKNDTIWVGNEWGLFIYTRDTVIRPFSSPIAGNYVMNVDIDRKGTIWVATKGGGVYYIQNNKIHILGKNHGINARNCNSLFIDEDDCVWVGSEEGLYKISKRGTSLAIRSFNHRSLLPSFLVNHVYKSGNYVFVSTNLGISFFDETKIIDNPAPPKVYLTGISINNQDTFPVNNLTLSYDKNNIRFDFTAIDYSAFTRPVFHYCLKGRDSVWVTTSQPSIDFSHIQPGKYTFYVAAENMDGRRSENLASMRFIVLPPFWETWWFQLLSGLGALALLIFIVRHFKRLERKERILLESKLKALRLHMNPHFIFNTLNSLQASILKNKPLEASDYVVKFSQLMRWVMSYSDRGELSLSEELDFLTTYTELERMRFDKEFELHIEIDPQIEINSTIIPALVIQPFVENAIKYGLSGKEGKCVLRIVLTKKDNCIQVVIQDNGVGRDSVIAEQAKSPISTPSTGIKYTEERLGILSNKRKAKNTVTIIDLFENGKPAGTRVDLLVPMIQ